MEPSEEQKPIKQEKSSPSAGALLQEARLKQGLTLEQVAEKLNLRAPNIVDIEADKIDPSMSLTFTRGYVKLYARMVGLDEAAVVQALDKNIDVVDKSPATLQSFSKKVEKEASDQKLMYVTYAIILVIVGLFILWAIQQKSVSLPLLSSQASSDSTTGRITPPIVSQADSNELDNNTELQTTESDDIDEGELLSASQIVEPVIADGEQDLQQTTATPISDNALPDSNVSNDADEQGTESLPTTDDTLANQLPADTIENDDVTTNELVDDAQLQVTEDDALTADDQAILALSSNTYSEADLVEMVFEFSADCWVNITDATGEDIAYGVKQAGRIMTVSGVPPIEVTLGAPSVVALHFDGDAIDMNQFPAGRTARFELPLLN